MNMGMTYEEYWNGDIEMPRYYLRAYKQRQDDLNFWAWMQGAYVYEAVMRLVPAINPFSGQKTIPGYIEDPFPLTEAQREKIQKRKEREAFEKFRAGWKVFTKELNESFQQREEVTDDGGQRTDDGT